MMYHMRRIEILCTEKFQINRFKIKRENDKMTMDNLRLIVVYYSNG